MKITREIALNNVEFWSGAKKTADRLKELDLMDRVEEYLEELYPDGIDETTLNDEFWFNDSEIYKAVGLDEEGNVIEEEEEDYDCFKESLADNAYDDYVLNEKEG